MQTIEVTGMQYALPTEEIAIDNDPPNDAYSLMAKIITSKRLGNPPMLIGSSIQMEIQLDSKKRERMLKIHEEYHNDPERVKKLIEMGPQEKDYGDFSDIVAFYANNIDEPLEIILNDYVPNRVGFGLDKNKYVITRGNLGKDTVVCSEGTVYSDGNVEEIGNYFRGVCYIKGNLQNMMSNNKGILIVAGEIKDIDKGKQELVHIDTPFIFTKSDLPEKEGLEHISDLYRKKGKGAVKVDSSKIENIKPEELREKARELVLERIEQFNDILKIPKQIRLAEFDNPYDILEYFFRNVGSD